MAERRRYQKQFFDEVEKNKEYLEGSYDGDEEQQRMQKREDEWRAIQTAKEIRASQEAVYEKETERLSCEYQAEADAFVQLMKDYIEKDKYQQYLVDRAVLRCTAATTDDFPYDGGTVVLENKADEVCNIILDVHENPVYEDPDSMTINNQIYATVKDTIQGLNINPPNCNCGLAADRDAENERIRGDADRNKNGVCRHLMRLNDTWDNFRVEGTEYLKRDNAIMVFDNGEDGQAVQVGSSIEDVAIEGITMTSVLFCKHGGLIMPVTSGQDELIREDVINTDTVFALACTLSGKHMGTLSWEQKKMNAEYIYDYLYEKNWSKESICGLLGNVYRECKMNPGVWHDWDNESSAYGIAQWTKGAFLKYYNLNKEDVDRMATEDPLKLMNSQLDYLIETMKPEYRIWGTGNRQEQYAKYLPSEGTPLLMSGEEYTKSLCTPKDLALVFHASYERSGDGVKELQERIDAAEEWYRYFSGEEVCEVDFP